MRKQHSSPQQHDLLILETSRVRDRLCCLLSKYL
nr:MAG TPA: hypothetical protein [Caudoviricetes sp.]